MSEVQIKIYTLQKFSIRPCEGMIWVHLNKDFPETDTWGI